jgi:hypothetical protein
MDMHPNARATGVPRRWKPEEDAKLISPVTNTSKTKHGKEYRTDRAEATVLVPGQTWHSSVDQTPARAGRWTTAEDTMLKNSLRINSGNNAVQRWDAIARLVPGRTKTQCRSRWRDAIDPRIDRSQPSRRATGPYIQWTPDEDTKLTNAVTSNSNSNHGKIRIDWVTVAALMPGREPPVQ